MDLVKEYGLRGVNDWVLDAPYPPIQHEWVLRHHFRVKKLVTTCVEDRYV
jgi:spore germination protein YaaH